MVVLTLLLTKLDMSIHDEGCAETQDECLGDFPKSITPKWHQCVKAEGRKLSCLSGGQRKPCGLIVGAPRGYKPAEGSV